MDTTTLVLATPGDHKAYALLRSALTMGLDASEVAADLFELSAESEGDLLDAAVAIAAEATSNPDPTPALAAWAALIGDPLVLSGVSRGDSNVRVEGIKMSRNVSRPLVLTEA